MENTFGIVTWNIEDIKNALEVQGYPITDNNVAKVYNLCQHHSFVDCMIAAGWEFMYNNIGNGEGWDE